jgi:hydroxymethylpyrimidine pyrophosphatase-like HAD family hydrolase
VPPSPFEKFYLQTITPVRIFSPELLSITGNNTNFEMQKLKQKSINVVISGRSRFEVESLYPELDSVNIKQSDSSSVTFEMSPDYRKQPNQQGVLQFHNAAGIAVPFKDQRQNGFDENMQINSVTATVKDHSILDIGHAQIKNLDINVSDSSAIILSGGALKKTKK